MTNKGKIRLEELLTDVYNVHIPEMNKLARTFVRFQEHYENPEFRGKVFTLDEFKEWYIANSFSGKKTGKFSYFQDWLAFNLPSHVLEPFYNGRFDPLSKEEVRLLNTFEPKRKTPFYVIGTCKKLTIATLKHELSHGLFYTNPEYRKQVLRVVDGMNSEDREKVHKYLSEFGAYHPSVFPDETQAYLLDRRQLGADGVSGEGLAKAGKEIKKIFKKYCR